MTGKKWVLLAVGSVGVVGLGLLGVFVLGFLAGHEEGAGGGPVLPIYTSDQAASAHAGYRRNTLTCGDEVYVNDYEEAGLQLDNPEPATVVGWRAALGAGKICAIPGEAVTAYVACDDGSEMPANVPYRSTKQKPFDWRVATFREMSVYRAKQGGPTGTTGDPALLAEVVRTLRDDTPVELPSISFATMADLGAIKMRSDELPGLLFCPVVRTDAKGGIYLAESLMLDEKSTPTQLNARWVRASPALAQWLKAP